MNRKIRVLLVDDDVDFARMTQLSLERTGKFEVTTKLDAKSGLEAATSSSPDVILLDLMMPQQSGGWLFNELRQDELLSHIPVITVSALIEKPDDQESALPERDKSGMISLWKPLNPDVLINAIEAEMK